MILSSLYYLPQISWFKEVIHEQSITLEQYDNWQKSSLKNKSIIAGANGLQTLSIPIIGGREQRNLYKDVRICYQEKWQHNHLLSIRQRTIFRTLHRLFQTILREKNRVPF